MSDLVARLPLGVGLAGSAVAAVCGPAAAVLNKVAPGRCASRADLPAALPGVGYSPGSGGGCDSFAELARLFFVGNGGAFAQFTVIMRVLVAAFFLACLACIASGWVQMANGSAGGGQRMMAGCWGVVVVLACVGVIL